MLPAIVLHGIFVVSLPCAAYFHSNFNLFFRLAQSQRLSQSFIPLHLYCSFSKSALSQVCLFLYNETGSLPVPSTTKMCSPNSVLHGELTRTISDIRTIRAASAATMRRIQRPTQRPSHRTAVSVTKWSRFPRRRPRC